MPNETITEWVNQPASQWSANRAWWKEKDDEVYRHAFQVCKFIEEQNRGRTSQYASFARLYGNMELFGFSRSVSDLDLFSANRITLNVIKSCVDTSTSKIAKTKPKPQFLSSNGDYFLTKQAKDLTRYLEGVFNSVDIYTVAQAIFRDACVFGTGVLKIFPEEGTVKIERLLLDEIFVDHEEGFYGKPRQLHQRKYVNRDVLIELFPDLENQIRSAASASRDVGSLKNTTADHIKVVESWHLPSGKDAKDGKHIISIENATLFAEEYSKDYFPFVFLRWSDPIAGFFGIGLAQELSGIQLGINKLLKSIQIAQHYMAVPRIFVENSTQIVTQQINNDLRGNIIKFSGQPPIFSTPPAMSPEVYQHLEYLYKKAYEITGISQLSAGSKKPSGIDSAVAMREFQDIESERFAIVGQRWESFFMDAAKIMVDISRDLYADNSKLSVKTRAGKFIEQLKFKDVNLENDEFDMQAFPVSILPSTPAGKLQMVQELVSAGFVGKEEALSLLDFPDLGAFQSVQTAALDDVRMTIGNMLEKGEYTAPEPFMNLDLAKELTQSAYLRGKTDNVPEERLDLLRRYIDDILTLTGKDQAPPAQAAEPTAVPNAPPQSDLLPVTGQPMPQ